MLRRLLILVLGSWAAWSSLPAVAETVGEQLVLVARTGSSSTTLDRHALRRLFLGLPVDSYHLVPMINRSDADLYQAFLQKVMFMSGRAYERQILSLAFRAGSMRPKLLTETPQLKKALTNTEGAVTFMWSSDLDDEQGLTVIQVLAGRVRP